MMYPERLLKVEVLFLGNERDKALDFVKKFPRFHVVDVRLRLHELIGYASPVYVDEYVVKLEDALRRLEAIRTPAEPEVLELPSEMFKAAYVIHKEASILHEEFAKYSRRVKELEEEISRLRGILEIRKRVRGRVPLPIPRELLGLFVRVGFTDEVPKDAVVFRARLGKRRFALIISDRELDVSGEELDPADFAISEDELAKRIEGLEKERSAIASELEARKRSVAPRVEALYRAAKVLLVKLGLLGRGALLLESVYLVEGRVPAKDSSRFMRALNEVAPGALVLVREPERSERPPTLFRPKRDLSKASHELTDVYGVTNYRELNPSRVVLLTFPIFFGMMFADIAHGIILVLFGRLARRYADKFPDYLSLFPKGSRMIMYMGLRAAIFGFLFGDFAGFELVHTSLGERLAKVPLFALAGEGFEGRILFLQYVSIVVAVLHITRGLALNLYDKLKKRDYYRALFVSLPRLVSYTLFIGPVGYLVLLREISPGLYRRLFPGMKILDAYFYLELEKNFLIYAVLVGSLMFPGSYLIAKQHGIPFFEAFIEAGFIHFIEAFVTSLSNTVSYLRLLALNLSHFLLGDVFIQMALQASNPLAAVAIYATGQLLVLIIESISASLHAIRLHRVEFFSKLDLSRDGERFKPITIRI